MKRLFLLLISLLAYLTPISAQEFIINPWGADELICYSANKTAEGFSVVYNEEQGLAFNEGMTNHHNYETPPIYIYQNS